MQATKATEQRRERKDSESQGESQGRDTSLRARYGRIGISAVAAAVSPKGEPKKKPQAAISDHALRYERE